MFASLILGLLNQIITFLTNNYSLIHLFSDADMLTAGESASGPSQDIALWWMKLEITQLMTLQGK